jgi:hypothetical protein
VKNIQNMNECERQANNITYKTLQDRAEERLRWVAGEQSASFITGIVVDTTQKEGCTFYIKLQDTFYSCFDGDKLQKLINTLQEESNEEIVLEKDEEGINLYSDEHDTYLIKVKIENLTPNAAHLIIDTLQELKEDGLPSELIDYCEEKFGCTLFCNGLNEVDPMLKTNMHLLFSGYMRDHEVNNEMQIPKDLQSLVIDFCGTPNHK